MKKITLITALLIGAVSFSQIAGTSFEEPETYTGKYTDTGDPNTAHDLLNNADEPLVNYTSTGEELGFRAFYVPYNTPSTGSTDGDNVGVTKKKPATSVLFTQGIKGYRMNDTDGNYILEFDPVEFSATSIPSVSVDYLLSINSNPANGNYEGDGTVNESGHDRLRIYIKDLTNTIEIDLFDSTGSNLDDFVPFDAGSGEYKLEWQTAMADLPPNISAQLIIEGRNNATSESFWFDNVQFQGALGIVDSTVGNFKIYPNPASQGFISITSKIKGPKNIWIYDVLGKLTIKTTLINERLDISNLNSGVYIIKIEQGNSTTTKKLVIK